MLNNFLVFLRLKRRVGVCRDITTLEVSFTSGGLCTKTQVGKMDYKYYWKSPFKKSINAKIRKTFPFVKHSNPDCPNAGKEI